MDRAEIKGHTKVILPLRGPSIVYQTVTYNTVCQIGPPMMTLCIMLTFHK